MSDTVEVKADATGARATGAVKPARTTALFPWQVLSGTALKVVAIVTMLIDHSANTLVRSQYRAAQASGVLSDAQFWLQVCNLMNTVGRFAFPIFCFLLVEGFVYTRSRPKYALRLFAFALISEIPFDFALMAQKITVNSTGIRLVVEFAHQNVMFTLLFGLLALCVADAVGMLVARIIGRVSGRDLTGMGQWLGLALTFATIPAFAYASNELDFDYHAFGVYLIGGLYVARRLSELALQAISDPETRDKLIYILSNVLRLAIVAVIAYIYCSNRRYYLEMWCLVGIGLIALYNGKRGRGGTFMKYFFYAFYPCHLLLLGWLKGVLF